VSSKKPKYSDLGKRVKQIRKLASLNQQQFGERVGCGGDNISKIEKGQSNPSPAVFKNIVREFGLTEDYLKHGTGEPYTPKESGFGDDRWRETAAGSDQEQQLHKRSQDLINKFARLLEEGEELSKEQFAKLLTHFDGQLDWVERAVRAERHESNKKKHSMTDNDEQT
jgi:transcriptional regulator with XRE-family HTH domain